MGNPVLFMRADFMNLLFQRLAQSDVLSNAREAIDLAGIVKAVVGYTDTEAWDRSKPDGTPRKLLDITRLTRTGWLPRIELKEGIRDTYEWYRRQTQ